MSSLDTFAATTSNVSRTYLLLHIIPWALILALPLLVSESIIGSAVGSIPGPLFTGAAIIHLILFYSNAFIYGTLCNKRHWLLYLVFSVALVIGTVRMKFYITARWFPEVLQADVFLRFLIAPSIVVMFLSIIYRTLRDDIEQQRRHLELRAAKLESDLKVFRSEISPHFLFNVVTSLASVARKSSKDLEQHLILLASLMRHVLYETQHTKVSLQKEVAFLISYLLFQKLRFKSELTIDYEIHTESGYECYSIEPMLLLPLVENAFKHTTAGKNPYVRVTLTITKGVLSLTTVNPMGEKHNINDKSGFGIGLQNVRSRLDLLYRGSYDLDILSYENSFYVHLTLKLC